MAEYLVEVYQPRHAPGGPAHRSAKVSAAAAQVSREGASVRLERSIFLPDEETCFYLFRAQSGDAVRETTRRAGLRAERVVEALSVRSPTGPAARPGPPGTGALARVRVAVPEDLPAVSLPGGS